jgi:hypothetical protein
VISRCVRKELSTFINTLIFGLFLNVKELLLISNSYLILVLPQLCGKFREICLQTKFSAKFSPADVSASGKDWVSGNYEGFTTESAYGKKKCIAIYEKHSTVGRNGNVGKMIN